MISKKHLDLAFALITKDGYKLTQFKKNGPTVLKKGNITLKLISI